MVIPIRDWGHTYTHEKNHLSDGSQTLSLVAQTGVSTLVDIQNWTGQGPEQPEITCP